MLKQNAMEGLKLHSRQRECMKICKIQKLYYYLFLITCNALLERYDILLFEQNNATLSM